MTEASTLAGENVLGSFKREITLKRIVLFKKQYSARLIKRQKSQKKLKPIIYTYN